MINSSLSICLFSDFSEIISKFSKILVIFHRSLLPIVELQKMTCVRLQCKLTCTFIVAEIVGLIQFYFILQGLIFHNFIIWAYIIGLKRFAKAKSLLS